MPYQEHHPYDFFPHRLLQEEMNDPFHVIAEFFFGCPLPDFRKDISTMLRAAHKPGYWKKNSPGDLLFLREQLERLIEAAYLINNAGLRKETDNALKVNEDIFTQDCIDPSLYCKHRYSLPTWDFFPRSISKKEFLNPYLAFEKFFKYHTLPEWRDELQDIIMYALNGDSADECGINIDYLATHRFLQKLIEAAYLIDVRVISEKTNIND